MAVLSRKRKALLDIAAHILCTVFVASLLYMNIKNPVYAGVFLLGGFFLDLDHLIDYFSYFKSGFSLNNFLGSAYLESGKVYVFMHSWEIDCLMLMASIATGSAGLLVFFLSVTLHLAIDNIQRKNPLFYFLIYRIRKGFDVNILLPEFSEG